MKKLIYIFLLLCTVSYGGVFEHLINKDKNYLFKHNFRCNNGICITSEKNIFDNYIMDTSVKVIKAFLDHEDKVFKVEIELSLHNEKKEAFYDAIIKTSDKSGKITYKSYTINDKYGNHPFIDIVNKQRRKKYIRHLSDIYYNTMKSYKK